MFPGINCLTKMAYLSIETIQTNLVPKLQVEANSITAQIGLLDEEIGTKQSSSLSSKERKRMDKERITESMKERIKETDAL